MIQFGVLRYGILAYCSMIMAVIFFLLTIGDAIFLILEIFFIPKSAIIIVLSLLGMASFITSGFFLFLCAGHFWELYKIPNFSINEFSLGIPRPMSKKEEDAYYLREGIQRNFTAGTDLGEVSEKYYAACELLQGLDIIDGNVLIQEDNL